MDHETYDIREVTVTHQLDTKSSFGVLPTGEEVFIPARLSTNHDLMVDDCLPMAIVKQTNASTSFKVIRVFEPEDDDDAPARVPAKELSDEQKVIRFLAGNGISAVRSITNAIHGEHGDIHVVKTLLTKMHTGGQIARADVYGAGEQNRASTVLYAIDKRVFMALSE
jgi:hypothetical protein